MQHTARNIGSLPGIACRLGRRRRHCASAEIKSRIIRISVRAIASAKTAYSRSLTFDFGPSIDSPKYEM